ncbi:transmembrane channel-like protein 5 [Contarinia nasturtii]|uniref:transmembrane channel-like protein 5 n=1 Tax=Contarinia nasturtii TaxID=265458 RepID=UPI0012D496DE|nr:transmembrane channel-like protein 5 [Contarinia nasturtii]
MTASETKLLLKSRQNKSIGCVIECVLDKNQNKRIMNESKNDSGQDVFFEIPVIITSSPSTESEASRMYRTVKLPGDSDEEIDTSFINNNDNNNAINRRISAIRSLSPGNLNSSNASRGNVRRWSQSLTNASKARNRLPTINMMPSRLQKLRTLSMDGQLHRIVDDESDFEQFVQEIEQYDYLMEDSATAAQMRNKIMQSLPQTLSVKRQIKARVTLIVKERSQRIGMNRWKRALHFFGLCSTQCKLIVRSFMRNLNVWNDSLKEIEGTFGASVQTYFRFFRLLFIVNLFLMAITFIFIVFPQMLGDYFQQRDDAVSPRSHATNVDELKNDEISVLDIITAEGSLENSTLFYGAYTDQRIKLYGFSTYSLPFAYLMTMVCFYALTFITFSITTAESYRKSFIATSGGEVLRAHKLFCSWDLAISNQKAAEMKHHNIYIELKSIVNQIYDNEYSLSIQHKMCSYMVSCVIWIFVIFILIVIGSSIVFLKDITEYFGDNGDFYTTYIENTPLFIPVIAVLLILLCQFLFECLGSLEIKIVRMYRSPRSQLHIALVRNYLLNIVTISSLAWFWLTNSGEKNCWETYFAQCIYRLILIEFVIVVCIGSVFRLIRFLIYKHLWSNIGLSEFNISRGCLALIFNQTLLWIGIFFSPPLAAVIVLKMVATFYLKKMVLINFCKPPSKLWRSSQTFTLFLAMIFVSLTIVIVIALYVLTQMTVSKTCGPFRNRISMFYVLREDILGLRGNSFEDHFFYQFFMFLLRPAAIGLLLLTLCVLVYYLRSKSRARIEMVKLLKQMLYTEAKDKEFLLANITRITQNNEWLLDDFMNQSQLLKLHKKNGNLFADQVNGNSSVPIEDDDHHQKYRKARFNGRLTNKGIEKTIRKRRSSTFE